MKGILTITIILPVPSLIITKYVSKTPLHEQMIKRIMMKNDDEKSPKKSDKKGQNKTVNCLVLTTVSN